MNEISECHFDTQPLAPEQAQTWENDLKEQPPDYRKAWDDLTKLPLFQAFQGAAKPKPHIHGPFTFIMNQNHNALRGCQSCGAAWVGLMAGNEESLCWHPVGELPEEG